MTKPSKPSKPSAPQPSRSRSTTSWTIPAPTDVLSYAYLLACEAERGEEDGRKDRLVVVVISRKIVDDGTELLVVPITTQQPRHPADGFEVPTRVKAHLGLNAERCWIMVTELNRFLWPGPDVRLVGRGPAATPFYGYIPQQLFDSVLAAIVARAKSGRVAITKRSR